VTTMTTAQFAGWQQQPKARIRRVAVRTMVVLLTIHCIAPPLLVCFAINLDQGLTRTTLVSRL
jgi:hypothetical protein